MLAFYKKECVITTSMCDSTAKLGVYNTFKLFQDIASEHAKFLRCDSNNLDKIKVFWVAVKTKIKFYRMPSLNEMVVIETWPEEPDRIRYNRDYRIVDLEGNTLVIGKTEWTLVNALTGKLYIGECVYPKNSNYFKDFKIDLEFDKVSIDFSDSKTIIEHKVKSMDIDLAHHMNNCEYVRVLLDAYSVKELEESPIKEIYFQYKTPSYEKDLLFYKAKTTENKTEIGIFNNEKLVSIASMIR